jgi:hypothetical protein
MITVQLNCDSSSYEIFDLSGKSVLKGTIQNGQSIKVNQLHKGAYLLNLSSETMNENKIIFIE